ncbi:ABC transporter ATP-binding protein [Clostridium thermarum]|uniref:ABC transporter ATP-binding protein n=1 Tax=Clostridium thermarum TaxID=1716543 RepID=UPI0013D5D7E3|nr:ABC transporter ATP-binding protein [Clostridium thermarum]
MNILQVENLSKSFGGKQIIKNISFNVEQGEIIGFVGPNGAGKTTTLKLISNLIFPESGRIIIDGNDIMKNREKALEKIAVMIESPGLYRNLSGKGNLKIIQRLRGKSKALLDEIIEFIGLSDRIDVKVAKYSLGMKQRLALGMCLLCEPRLLILDEPTNGLDPTGTMEFRELITTLAKREKISVLFSSHLLSEVEKISDRIMFIKDGQIVTIKSIKDIGDNTSYRIQVSDVLKSKAVLENSEYINSISNTDTNIILVSIKNNKLSNVLNLLSTNDIDFWDIEKVGSSIESDYSDIYKGVN